MVIIKLTMLIIVLLFFGCNSNSFNRNNEEIETIDLTPGLIAKGKAIKLSEYADDIQYIFLETSDDCLIYEIDKIMVDDSLVFIFNKEQFLIFDTTGKFKRSIGRVGKGPGEFLSIMDFTINTNENTIYIYDYNQRKVICYKYNGDLVFEFRLNTNPMRIASLNNESLILSWVKPDFISNDNYGFTYYTMNGIPIEKAFNRENEKAKSEILSGLSQLNYYCDSLTYWEIYLNTIYRIAENGKVIPRYKIIYDNYKPFNDISRIEEGFFYYGFFIETESYLFFLRGVFNNEIKHLIYNKKTRDIQNLNFNHKNPNYMLKYGFVNDIDGGLPFLPKDALIDGRLYCTFFPYELKGLIEQNIYDQIEIKDTDKQKELLKKIGESKDTDNPVIMLVKFK